MAWSSSRSEEMLAKLTPAWAAQTRSQQGSGRHQWAPGTARGSKPRFFDVPRAMPISADVALRRRILLSRKSATRPREEECVWGVRGTMSLDVSRSRWPAGFFPSLLSAENPPVGRLSESKVQCLFVLLGRYSLS